MFAEFMAYYRYNASDALNEYAKRFFALCSSMYRLQAKSSLETLVIANTINSDGKNAQKLADQYKKQIDGNDQILREVRNIKK